MQRFLRSIPYQLIHILPRTNNAQGRGKILLFLVLWGVLTYLTPEIILALTAINLIAFTLIFFLRCFSVMLPHKVPVAKTLGYHPKVSVHVPTYNEPPEVVINTLKALTRLDYDNYEVIILDNNTQEEHIWKPVEKYCQDELGENFHYYHIDQLSGYKAGALNVCLEKTADDAEFILVIDADYQVDSHLLLEAIGCFYHNKVGLVQFPQAYFNASDDNLGLQSEYEHFFSVYMNMANHYDCVLSTGTVSVIRREALLKAGSWQDNTITEDVELGLRLKNAGFKGVYVPKALGRGLMPTDISALKTQRERWIYGNMQTLKIFIQTFWKNMKIKQSLGILALLTAWYNFMLIPVLALLFSTITRFVSHSPILYDIQIISLGSIWFSIVGTFLFFLIAFINRKQPTRNAVEAFLVHMSLLWEGAISWVACLVNTKLIFKRTNKFPLISAWSKFIPGMAPGLIFFFTGLLLWIYGEYSLSLLSLCLAPLGLTVLFLKKQLENTAKLTTSNKLLL
jgi:cellulose synthase/poly-beta-1,6-N-acetylglucosamine synthase-like glycosyltransferase